ncbi:aminotransferase class III-fold pyridoxal phosphate-dependent enzyme [Candidatus Uhrbacteria bacterium]|nr:aminotransferase class III-fold pyridoxal phosphate-dependent enzyme [Candidatus Uhrbacteria bacterium]
MPNIAKSFAMQERARKRIPGISQLLSKQPDRFSYGVWPGYYERAKGVEVWDLDGNHYIDMSIGGIGANVLGYADNDVDGAVGEAISKGSSSSLNCPEEVELADLLCELHPWAQKVRYARGGGEAMAVAVRIARAYTDRDKVAFCGYHGWHDWYLAANIGTEDALGEHLLKGLEPRGVPKALQGTALPFRYNHLEELEQIAIEHKGELAAIVMEPIRDHQPQAGFLEGVRRIADEVDVPLIFDEVSSGFRMNTGGAHLKFGVNPDIAVFSKAMGNGYPIAAIIGRGAIMDASQNSFISSTMWTERVGPTAALATIKKHRAKNVGEHLMKIGQAVQEGWKQVAAMHKVEIEVSGMLPLSHFSFKHENKLALKALFVQLMLEKGFLASTSFYAMYAHTQEHVAQYVAAAARAFAELADAIRAGDIEKRLKGKPSQAGFERLT